MLPNNLQMNKQIPTTFLHVHTSTRPRIDVIRFEDSTVRAIVSVPRLHPNAYLYDLLRVPTYDTLASFISYLSTRHWQVGRNLFRRRIT